ncbi:hypothetical protein CALVIDRAFT_596974 [Calocera viscosa TUFC12733]|uniref:DASH complex subunit SPC19 n=1 Tax=Calocera viscosa (strain TUFC12733) TaxID=1330018 RepID=A0A167NQN5_CALVF|nr:hypothetical protein CALVIDRAFT_596974 [Calocera viscosa TUFC12733]
MDYRRSSVYPRHSVFPSATGLGSGSKGADGPRPYLPHLEACINATNQSTDTLKALLEDFNDGTGDLPRLTKVLENSRLFVLINEDVLRKYKAQLADEIEPQVGELIAKAEKSLGVLERREVQLQKKIEVHRSNGPAKPAAPAAASKAEERRAKLMAARRDRLMRELKALEDEVESLGNQVGDRS